MNRPVPHDWRFEWESSIQSTGAIAMTHTRFRPVLSVNASQPPSFLFYRNRTPYSAISHLARCVPLHFHPSTAAYEWNSATLSTSPCYLLSLCPPPPLFWTLLIQCIVIPELNDKEGSGGPREEELKRTSRLIEINSKDCGRLGTTSLRRFYLLPSSRSNAASCSAKCRSRFLLRHILLQEIPLK